MVRKTIPAACVMVMIAAAACDEQAAPTSHEGLHGNLVLSATDIDPGLVGDAHAATAKFHSTVQASKAGYEIDSPCVAHPTLGTMGFHWVNKSLVDPVFNPLQPETLVYVPDGNGNLNSWLLSTS